MEINEFIKNPAAFSFEVNPLDINLAQMQTALLQKMKTAERVEGAVLQTIRERYVSKNPLRAFGEIRVEIYKYRGSLSSSIYRARAIAANKEGNLVSVIPLYSGDWSWMERFINGELHTWGDAWDFFSLCKANALWVDYCVKHDELEHLRVNDEALQQELLSEEDYLDFYMIGERWFCHGHPALTLKRGYPIGEGMVMFRGDGEASLTVVNTQTKEIRQLVDEKGNVVGFGEEDFDWEKLKSVEHRWCLDSRTVAYAGINRYSNFHNGVCCLQWMLYPDGRYFADEDGYGMEDNDEENIYCVIDRHLRVIVPFQPMSYEEVWKWAHFNDS